jgi:hypothetical protein
MKFAMALTDAGKKTRRIFAAAMLHHFRRIHAAKPSFRDREIVAFGRRYELIQ